MSWLRPTHTVDGPGGQTWEVYVTRGIAPSWRAASYDAPTKSPRQF